ncbi:MAG: hypothetical protein WDN01_10930 [Rhizomicrobium sp.]
MSAIISRTGSPLPRPGHDALLGAAAPTHAYYQIAAAPPAAESQDAKGRDMTHYLLAGLGIAAQLAIVLLH